MLCFPFGRPRERPGSERLEGLDGGPFGAPCHAAEYTQGRQRCARAGRSSPRPPARLRGPRLRECDVILPDGTTHAGRTPAHWRPVALVVALVAGKRWTRIFMQPRRALEAGARDYAAFVV